MPSILVPLADISLFATDRVGVLDNFEFFSHLVLPAAKRAFPTVKNWPEDNPLLVYNALADYFTPTPINRTFLDKAVCDQYTFMAYSIDVRTHEAVNILREMEIFKTKSGRDMVEQLVKESVIPIPNCRVSQWFLSPMLRDGLRILAALARTSFAFDVEKGCITVDDADVVLATAV